MTWELLQAGLNEQRSLPSCPRFDCRRACTSQLPLLLLWLVLLLLTYGLGWWRGQFYDCVRGEAIRKLL